MTLRIAWFASARGTSSRLLLRAALEAIREGRLDAEVVCVFCNRERWQSDNTDAFLDDVVAAGIPLIESSSLAWRRRVCGAVSDPQGKLAKWRRGYDEHALREIGKYRPDLAVLAGYMMVTTEALCEALPMLNLHPALPNGPIGTWQEVIFELIEKGANESGMSLQRITAELDRGPAVSTCCYPLPDEQFASLRAQDDVHSEDSELFRAIRAEGVKRESVFLVESLKKIAEDPKLLEPNAMSDPFDLTKRVDEELTETVDEELAKAVDEELSQRERREREGRERAEHVTGEQSAVPEWEPVGDPEQGGVLVAAGA